MRTHGIGGVLLLAASIGLFQAEENSKTFGFDGKLKDGVPELWEVRRVAGKPDFKIVTVPERGDEKLAYLHAKDSSFSLNRAVGLDPEIWRHVSWSWKGEKLPTGKAADARVGSSCDQGLQVLIAFDSGKRIISYVWDTNAPVDTRTTESAWYSPYTVKVIVVQSGEDGIGKWSTIERDLLADYLEVFDTKRAPRKVALVRVQSNSQYTGTEGAGYFGPITFKKSSD